MIPIPTLLLLAILVLPATGTAIVGVVPWRYRWRVFGGGLIAQLGAIAAFVLDGAGWGVTVRVLPLPDAVSLGVPVGECSASGVGMLIVALGACCALLVRLAGERLRSRRRAIGLGAMHLGITLLALAGDLLVPVMALALFAFGLVMGERTPPGSTLGRGGVWCAALLCAALVGSVGLGSMGVVPDGAALTGIAPLLDRAAVAMMIGAESSTAYLLAALLPTTVLLVLLLLLPRVTEERGGAEGAVVQLGVLAAPLLMLHLLQLMVLPLFCIDREVADVLGVIHIVAVALAVWWGLCALGTDSVGGVVGYLHLGAVALALALLCGNLTLSIDLVIAIAGTATIGAAISLASLAQLGRGDNLAMLDGMLRGSPVRRTLLLLGCTMMLAAGAAAVYLALTIEYVPTASALFGAVVLALVAAVRLVRRVGWGVIRSPELPWRRIGFDRGALLALTVALLALAGVLAVAEEVTQGDRSILQRRLAPERRRTAIEVAEPPLLAVDAGEEG